MKITDTMFLLGVQEKLNKENQQYLIINIADSDGNSYSIMSKDLKYKDLDNFKPYNVELNLSNSKYGLRLEILGIN